MASSKNSVKKIIATTPVFLLLLAFLFAFTMCCEKNVAQHETAPTEQTETAVEEVPDIEFVDVPEVRREIIAVNALEVHSVGGKGASWYDGVTSGDKVIKYKFRVPGVISDINYKTGDRMLYERVLARLDSAKQEHKVDELEALVEKLDLENIAAKAKYAEIAEKYKKGEVPVEELNAAYREMQRAELKLRKNRNKLQSERAVLGYHEIRIHDRGVISAVNVKEGDSVKAGQVFAEMKLTEIMKVTVNVPNILVSHVGIKSRANVKFSEGLRGTYPADVLAIGKLNNDPRGTTPVTVKMRRPYPNMNSGMKARVAFRFDYRLYKKHYILPHGSMGNDENGRFVYVLVPTEGDLGTLERRSVVAGNSTAWGQEVGQGVKNGELIVVDNIDLLHDKMTVKWK